MCKSEFIKNKIPALWKTLLREKTSHRLEKNIYCIKHIPDKGLVSKIYKELLKFNKKTTQLKMSKRYEQRPHQRRYTDGK